MTTTDEPVSPAVTTPVVLTERRDAVLLVTLHRPHRRNAWTQAMAREYVAALADADADPDVRAVVITGAGDAFCVGADMEVLSGIGASGTDGLDLTPPLLPASFALSLTVPLIAAINGPAAGVGLVQALYADVRFAAPGTKITTSFARRGLIAEYGSAWLLPRLVGHSRALDLLLSARTLTADQAADIGLVDHLADDPLAAALAYADDLATSCSPTSIALIKRQIYRDWERSLPEAVAEAEAMMVASFSRPDLVEGVTSWLEKRPPRFPPYHPDAQK